ncbi:hypothetical protein F2P81_007547 [Scophthalmus maximus]|uniref:Uncharacterized protein n=1 Tax=Scophthalmus maximus TaxID=52904 RepID=A0A6A4TAW1_SCOMX|nr:hypothetical protein F2P81_007547 [Scophthalmus maximus]
MWDNATLSEFMPHVTQNKTERLSVNRDDVLSEKEQLCGLSVQAMSGAAFPSPLVDFNDISPANVNTPEATDDDELDIVPVMNQII